MPEQGETSPRRILLRLGTQDWDGQKHSQRAPVAVGGSGSLWLSYTCTHAHALARTLTLDSGVPQSESWATLEASVFAYNLLVCNRGPTHLRMRQCRDVSSA